jgi:hypothetical protein
MWAVIAGIIALVTLALKYWFGTGRVEYEKRQAEKARLARIEAIKARIQQLEDKDHALSLDQQDCISACDVDGLRRIRIDRLCNAEAIARLRAELGTLGLP